MLERPKGLGRVFISPDPEIFESTEFSFDTIANRRMRQQAYLTKGITLRLKDNRDGRKIMFYFEGGIKSYVQHLNRDKECIGGIILC